MQQEQTQFLYVPLQVYNDGTTIAGPLFWGPVAINNNSLVMPNNHCTRVSYINSGDAAMVNSLAVSDGGDA